MSPRPVTVFSQDDATLRGRPDPDNPTYVRMNRDSPIKGDFDVDASALIVLEHLKPRVRARLASSVLDALAGC